MEQLQICNLLILEGCVDDLRKKSLDLKFLREHFFRSEMPKRRSKPNPADFLKIFPETGFCLLLGALLDTQVLQ